MTAFKAEGPAGIVSRRCGQRCNRELDEDFMQTAISLIRANYADFGSTLTR